MTNPDGKVDRFLEKPGWSEVFSDTVNAGIYIIEPEALRQVHPDKQYDFSKELFPKLLRNGDANLCLASRGVSGVTWECLPQVHHSPSRYSIRENGS